MRESQTNIVMKISWDLLTEFDQPFTTNGRHDKDERVKFWNEKVKGQAHGRVKYTSKCTFWSCSCQMLVEAY